jgi:hypothetical protein
MAVSTAYAPIYAAVAVYGLVTSSLVRLVSGIKSECCPVSRLPATANSMPGTACIAMHARLKHICFRAILSALVLSARCFLDVPSFVLTSS